MGNEATNIKSFYKGQSIYQEGQAGTSAFLVQDGSVSLFKVNENKKQLIARLGKGEIFGEMGALAGSSRTESAEASEYCNVMVISKQMIQHLLSQSPKTVKQLVNLLLRKVNAAERRADGTKTHKNTFLAICRLLDMACRNHCQAPTQEARKDPNHGLGLKRSLFARICKDVLLVSELDIDSVLEKLASLKIITLDAKKMSKAFSEKFIQIPTPDTFLQVSANFQKELQKAGEDECVLEYIDISDFAEAVSAKPEIIYKKIAQGEIPETLFFFDHNHTLAWAKTKGRNFFQKVTRKKKNIEDLEDVNDVPFVDKATLKEVLATLGYYKTGILIAVAEEDAKKKILGTLSKKIATIVQEEARNRKHVDESEADDIQDELISMIKTIKGVPA